jgi:anti-anti-sigma regulatory factor
MSKRDSTETTLHLNGDWSICGIGEQFRLVAEKFAVVAGRQSDTELPPVAVSRFTIDLAGIDAIDACGCQFLLILFGTLEQIGMNPVLIGIPDTVRNNIRLLGFDHELSAVADDDVEVG